jgi:hypothetical protein
VIDIKPFEIIEEGKVRHNVNGRVIRVFLRFLGRKIEREAFNETPDMSSRPSGRDFPAMIPYPVTKCSPKKEFWSGPEDKSTHSKMIRVASECQYFDTRRSDIFMLVEGSPRGWEAAIRRYDGASKRGEYKEDLSRMWWNSPVAS